MPKRKNNRYYELRSEIPNKQRANQIKYATDEPEPDREDTYLSQSQVQYQLQRTLEGDSEIPVVFYFLRRHLATVHIAPYKELSLEVDAPHQ